MNNKQTVAISQHMSTCRYMPEPVRLNGSRVLIGCNSFHERSVFCQQVDFGDWQHLSTSVLGESFAQAYRERFDGLNLPGGLSADFLARMASPTGANIQEALLEAILAVQAAVDFTMNELGGVEFAAISAAGDHCELVWSLQAGQFAGEIAACALKGLQELLPDPVAMEGSAGTASFKRQYRQLLGRATRRRLPFTTAIIMSTARRRGVPCELVGRRYLTLGHGVAQQSIYNSMTATTSVVAQKICKDKRLTRGRLDTLGLPTPRQARVGSRAALRKAAETVGYPLVVKPRHGKQGSGITVDVKTPEALEAAYESARKFQKEILLEQFIPGNDNRLLIVDGKFIAGLVRRPASVTGTGHSTIAGLIDELNTDPRRQNMGLFPVEVDDELLTTIGWKGFRLEDVLPAGQELVLRSVPNMHLGGISTDVTDIVHPDNRSMAERAAKGLGLDVAGVDFVTTDISRSYREVGGAIVEVNAGPGFDIHHMPAEGQSRDVAGALVDYCFADPADARIPVVAVCGDRGTGGVARLLEMLLRANGRTVGLRLNEEAYIGGQDAELDEERQAVAPLELLKDPAIDSLVTTVSLRGSAEKGLLLEHCAVSIVMDRAKPGRAELFEQGLAVIDRATSDCVVVGAGNRVGLNGVSTRPGRRLIVVAERPDDPSLSEFDSDVEIVSSHWHENDMQVLLMQRGKILRQVPVSALLNAPPREYLSRSLRPLLFAVAGAFALGLSDEDMLQSVGRQLSPIQP